MGEIMDFLRRREERRNKLILERYDLGSGFFIPAAAVLMTLFYGWLRPEANVMLILLSYLPVSYFLYLWFRKDLTKEENDS